MSADACKSGFAGRRLAALAFAILFIALPAKAQLTFKQAAGGNATATTATATYGSGTTSGSLLIAAFVQAGSFVSITDTIGNTWQLATTGSFLPVYYAINKGSGADTVTITQGTAVFQDLAILEYTAQNSGQIVDSASAVVSGSGTAVSIGPITANYPNETLICIFQQTSNSNTFTAGSGFTKRFDGANALKVEDITQPSTGSYTATATISSQSWNARFVGFLTFTSIPGTGSQVGAFAVGP